MDHNSEMATLRQALGTDLINLQDRLCEATDLSRIFTMIGSPANLKELNGVQVAASELLRRLESASDELQRIRETLMTDEQKRFQEAA